MVQAKDNDALPNYDDMELVELVSEDGDNAAPGVPNIIKPTGHGGVHTTSFKDMLLLPAIQQAIEECGFEHPSDV